MVGVFALGFCVWSLVGYWQRLSESRVSISVVNLILATGLVSAGYLCLAYGWHQLMRSVGAPVRLHTALFAWFSSQVGKYVPGKVMTAIMRVHLSNRDGALPSKALAATALEIIISLVVCVGVWTISRLSTLGSEKWDSLYWVYVLPLPLLMALLHPKVITWTMNAYYRWRKMPDAVPHLTVKDILRSGGFYVLGWVLYGYAGYFAARALAPMEVTSFVAAFRITGDFALAWALGYLAVIAPAGLGAREGVTVFLLQAWVPLGPAAAIAALARLCQTGTELAMAGALWIVDKLKPIRSELGETVDCGLTNKS